MSSGKVKDGGNQYEHSTNVLEIVRETYNAAVQGLAGVAASNKQELVLAC
jgi:hypothetical protein